jgi:hypothetical protein
MLKSTPAQLLISKTAAKLKLFSAKKVFVVNLFTVNHSKPLRTEKGQLSFILQNK